MVRFDFSLWFRHPASSLFLPILSVAKISVMYICVIFGNTRHTEIGFSTLQATHTLTGIPMASILIMEI